MNTKIKICGVSRKADIDAVNHALPDFVGFVFAPSRRRVDIQTAATLKAALDPRIKSIGVFVNEDIDTVVDIYRSGIIDMAQLHGDEDNAYMKQFRELCDCCIIKAVGIGETLPTLPETPDYLLFDTLSSERGGVGRAFDWDVLKDYSGLPYFLAGGLDVGNVQGALKTLSPFCVDVSSGVETDGVKDANKIEDFVRIVRRNGK
ncbi:MAG: phosphoribosylanthranilate isomerase [Clostridiales bacterium]|nr:phosphoribosylanthranilate isomerase [Clostridiales bacterium]